MLPGDSWAFGGSVGLKSGGAPRPIGRVGSRSGLCGFEPTVGLALDGPDDSRVEESMDWHRRTGPEARREESEDGSSSAMIKNRSHPGGPVRRAFSTRSWAKPPGLALLGLALLGLIQSGCRSDGCSTCGFASKLTNGVQALGARVFNHKTGCDGGLGCGCGGEEGTIVNSGIAVVPGGMAVPAPGTIIPAPAVETAPTQLEAIPSTQPANPTSGTGVPRATPAPPRPEVHRAVTTARLTPPWFRKPGLRRDEAPTWLGPCTQVRIRRADRRRCQTRSTFWTISRRLTSRAR